MAAQEEGAITVEDVSTFVSTNVFQQKNLAEYRGKHSGDFDVYIGNLKYDPVKS